MTQKWQITGASVIGPSHISKQMPNQDAFLYREIEDATYVLTVSDGHGGKSHPNSHIGSKVAVEVTTEIITQYYQTYGASRTMPQLRYDFEQTLSKDIHRVWLERIRSDESYDSGDALSGDVAYGCTLIACLVTKDYLVFLQIGDGKAVVVYEDDTVFYPIHHDERFALNETASLSQPNAWAEMNVNVIENPHAVRMVALSTDGVENAYPDQLYDDHAFYQSVSKGERTLEELVTKAASYSKDDTTSVCLVASPACDSVQASCSEVEAVANTASEIWITEMPEGWRLLSEFTGETLNKRLEMAYAFYLAFVDKQFDVDGYVTLKQILYQPIEGAFYRLYAFESAHVDSERICEALLRDLLGEAFVRGEGESLRETLLRLQKTLYYDYESGAFDFKAERSETQAVMTGIKGANDVFEIFHNSEIYLHQLMPMTSTVDLRVGKVVQHPKHPSVWGLVNLTAHTWDVFGSVQTQIPPGKTLTLKNGVTVFIHGIPINVQIKVQMDQKKLV